MSDILSKTEAAIDTAKAAGMFEARKRIKQRLMIPQLSEWEFETAFDDLAKLLKGRIDVRPDVWAYAMMCLSEGIRSLRLKGKTCQEPLEPSPISPTKSTE